MSPLWSHETRNAFGAMPLCRTQSFCEKCRDRESGRDWRGSLAAAYVLPDGAPDFDCPYGVAWGGGPDLDRTTSMALRELVEARSKLCRACDEFNGAVCERRFSCGTCLSTWLAWLGDASSACPLERWEAVNLGKMPTAI